MSDNLSLPADPRFAITASASSPQTITSPVSLKDVVMSRSCSVNSADLNRDPAVRRTYVRNKHTNRLESQDVPAQGVNPLVGDRKRSLQDLTSSSAVSSKRVRLSAGNKADALADDIGGFIPRISLPSRSTLSIDLLHSQGADFMMLPHASISLMLLRRLHLPPAPPSVLKHSQVRLFHSCQQSQAL